MISNETKPLLEFFDFLIWVEFLNFPDKVNYVYDQLESTSAKFM